MHAAIKIVISLILIFNDIGTKNFGFSNSISHSSLAPTSTAVEVAHQFRPELAPLFVFMEWKRRCQMDLYGNEILAWSLNSQMDQLVVHFNLLQKNSNNVDINVLSLGCFKTVDEIVSVFAVNQQIIIIKWSLIDDQFQIINEDEFDEFIERFSEFESYKVVHTFGLAHTYPKTVDELIQYHHAYDLEADLEYVSSSLPKFSPNDILLSVGNVPINIINLENFLMDLSMRFPFRYNAKDCTNLLLLTHSELFFHVIVSIFEKSSGLGKININTKEDARRNQKLVEFELVITDLNDEKGLLSLDHIQKLVNKLGGEFQIEGLAENEHKITFSLPVYEQVNFSNSDFRSIQELIDRKNDLMTFRSVFIYFMTRFLFIRKGPPYYNKYEQLKKLISEYLKTYSYAYQDFYFRLRVYYTALMNYLNANKKYNQSHWKGKLNIFLVFHEFLEEIVEIFRGHDEYYLIQMFIAELKAYIGFTYSRLNDHQNKESWYRSALGLYNVLRDNITDPIISRRIMIFQRLLKPKIPGYVYTNAMAGGIEMEMKVYYVNEGERIKVDFSELPHEILIKIQNQLNERLAREYPNAMFQFEMDFDEWEMISSLMITDVDQEKDLTALYLEMQRHMMSIAIPFFNTHIKGIIMEDREIQQAMLDAFEGEFLIEDLLAHIDQKMETKAAFFHFNKMEERGATDKNLQWIDLFSILFLYHGIGPKNFRYKGVRGLDSWDPIRGASDNYRPGRNEILLRYAPIEESQVSFDLSEISDSEFVREELERISKEHILKNERSLHNRISNLKEDSSQMINVDLGRVYHSFILATLAWYQKHDLGERHNYDHEDFPILGLSPEEVAAIVTEMEFDIDRRLESLGDKTFRELLNFIVGQDTFVVEYLSLYGTVDEYLYLVYLSQPGGPEIQKVMDEQNNAQEQNPDEWHSLRDYTFSEIENTLGYRLYPSMTDPHILDHQVEMARKSVLTSSQHKGFTITHFVLEVPEEMGFSFVIHLDEIDLLRGAVTVIKNNLEFASRNELLRFLGLGAEGKAENIQIQLSA